MDPVQYQSLDKRRQFDAAMSLLCRSAVDVKPNLYAAGDGDASGDALTSELRNELLKKLAAGEYVAVDVDMLAFEQQAGVANRNFVRFRDQSLLAMGRTGRGKPFLRDHTQWNSLAVAGRIITSKTTELADGHYQIHQRARLTASWAVDLALRDLLGAVSIGWEPTGPIECSVCQADIRRDGWACHWPGMRLSEMTGADGKKKLVYDRAGKLVVEWIYTDADLIETSMCPIGGVRTAGVGGVRAALAAAGIEMPDDELPALAALSADSTPAGGMPEPVLTTEESMSDKKPEAITGTLAIVEPEIVVLTDAQHSHYQKLGTADREKFVRKTSAERDGDVAAALSADPVAYTAKDGTTYRQSQSALAGMAKRLDDQADALQKSQDLATLQAYTHRASTELAALPGKVETKIAALRAIDSIADADQRAEALRMLTAAKVVQRAPGVDPGTPAALADSPDSKLEALAMKIMVDQKLDSLELATALALETAEGARLYTEIARARTTRNHQPSA